MNSMTPEQIARSDAKALGVGILINKLRKQKGLTQAELGERMGVTQQAISKIEWGEDIQLSTLRRVFEALDAELVLHTSDGDIRLPQLAGQ